MSPLGIALGAATALLIAGAAPRARAGRWPSSAAAADPSWSVDRGPTVDRRRWLRVVALAAAVGIVAPPLALAVVLAPVVRGHLRRRRVQRAHHDAVARSLPEAVDLLLLCSGAGLSLPLAMPTVAEHVPGPVGEALRAAEDAVGAGHPRAEATLEQLGPLGDRAVALGHVLVDHLRYGVPLVPALERTGLELRLARRRRAEEEARRLPVRLLAPLLLCVLPAFVLLSVVPLLVAALRSLPR